MKEIVFSSPFFGISISVFTYFIGLKINQKTKIALFNPLLISYVLIIAFLFLFNIPLSDYDQGGDIINMFLSPATAVLAINVYKERRLLKENALVLLVSCFVGSLTSVLSVYILSNAFGLEENIMLSLVAKGITTPMALSVSSTLGGIGALTTLSVIITGIFGAVFGPILIKAMKVKNEIAVGIALGTTSHAVGTSKALEIGEKEGALSSIALVLTGIITVLLTLLIF